jgi:hypothetical protein
VDGEGLNASWRRARRKKKSDDKNRKQGETMGVLSDVHAIREQSLI